MKSKIFKGVILASAIALINCGDDSVTSPFPPTGDISSSSVEAPAESSSSDVASVGSSSSEIAPTSSSEIALASSSDETPASSADAPSSSSDVQPSSSDVASSSSAVQSSSSEQVSFKRSPEGHLPREWQGRRKGPAEGRLQDKYGLG